MDKQTVSLGLVLAAIITGGLLLTYGVLFPLDDRCEQGAYCMWGWLGLTVTLLLSMVATLFGILALSGARNDDGTFREARIRFAIAATLLVVYFVLFSNAVLWGTSDKSINDSMMATLTQLMTIVLPFYFGTSGIVEWAKIKQKSQNNAAKSS